MYDASPDLKFGLALTAPFGLQTQYDSDWIGRYQAIRSDIATININPNVAYRVSDWLSVGGGPAIQTRRRRVYQRHQFYNGCTPCQSISAGWIDPPRWPCQGYRRLMVARLYPRRSGRDLARHPAGGELQIEGRASDRGDGRFYGSGSVGGQPATSEYPCSRRPQDPRCREPGSFS